MKKYARVTWETRPIKRRGVSARVRQSGRPDLEKNVVHLFGASGSGTSTLGRAISEKTGWFFMDTDDYFWAPADPPFTVRRAAPERLKLMRGDIERHGHAVIAGSLADWGDELIPLFTLAVRVETAAAIRIRRLEKRERERFGSRIDRGGDMYDIHRAFMEWAAAYDGGGPEMRSRAKHDAWQKLLRCPVIPVDGGLPVEVNFGILQRYL